MKAFISRCIHFLLLSWYKIKEDFKTKETRAFEKLATKLIIFKNGEAKIFLGDYQEFLRKEGWGEIEVKKAKKSSGDRKESKRKRAELIQERAKRLKPIKSEIDQLELLPKTESPPFGGDLKGSFPKIYNWCEDLKKTVPGYDISHQGLLKAVKGVLKMRKASKL